MKKKIILVFKTHFDIGFTDLACKVKEKYTNDMLHEVITTCEATKHMGSLKYIWTMPSWPLKLMTEQAKPQDLEKLYQLIENHQIAWHALPFTSHFDFCGPSDYIHGLTYAVDLAKKFHKPIPISAKMTDVPGHGALLPEILSGGGIKFLHLGTNEFPITPQVPYLFHWAAPSGKSILTIYEKGGYGSSLLPPPEWKYPVWMALMHTHDNCGPQSADMIEAMVKEIREQCPDADICCGTMDDFYHELMQYDLSDVPVITGDMADSWIHGVGSYPKESAQIRELRRTLRNLECQYSLQYESLAATQKETLHGLFNTAYENLILFGEHTWGLDVKTWLGNDRHYIKPSFIEAKNTEKYKYMEESWQEQKQLANNALDACLHITALLEHKKSFFVSNEHSNSNIQLNCKDELCTVENHRYQMEFNAASGKIWGLYDKKLNAYLLKEINGVDLFSYRYDIYGIQDIDDYLRKYARRFSGWGVQDNGRESYPECEHMTFYPQFKRYEILQDSICFYYHSNDQAWNEFGDGKTFCLTVTFPKDKEELYIEFQIEEKEETPFIEGGTLQFPLPVSQPDYFINKNGCVLRPEQDMISGANHVFYCLEHFAAAKGDALTCIVTKDVALMSIGETGVYNYRMDYEQHDPVLMFNLFNNMWGTNFPQWMGGTFRYRFVIFGEEKDKLPNLTKKALNLGYLEEQESSSDETCFEAFFTNHQVQLPSETIPLFLKPWEVGLVLCLRDTAGVQREDSLCWYGKELCLTDLRNLDDSKKVKDRLDITIHPYELIAIRIIESDL